MHHAPLLPSPPRLPSKLRRVFDVEPERTPVPEEPAVDCLGTETSPVDSDTVNASDPTASADAAEGAIFHSWRHNMNLALSDSEDELEDDHGFDLMEEDIIDGDSGEFSWDRLETGSGLSSWDQLGEGYERDAANIAAKLSEYDLAICRAFAYKVQTHTTDEDFRKLPHAFPSNPPLPRLDKLRSRVTFLSGFQPELYDCCPKACCCYVGPHVNLSQCPYCKEPRYRPDGKPRKRFTYIPITPRLISLVGNHRMAEQMTYRAHIHKHTPGNISDVFDGSHYRSLCGQHVQFNGRQLSHKYFEDNRDVALGLSADGFSPFKKRKLTAWAFILFNYNLPPDLRFHAENILALGVIGPRKPVDPDSFLWPAIQELLRLLVGVRAFDAMTSAIFSLRAFLILVFGDMPAVAMLMRMKGHNAVLPCRMCRITGLRIPGSRATAHYVPLDRSRHPDVRATPTAVKAFDPHNLPIRAHDEIRARAEEVQCALNATDAEGLAKAYGINGLSILFYLPSISFPVSFPFDFMHLIWENLIPNLVLLWTGNFKGLDQGTHCYELPNTIWDAIGEATAASGRNIPSAYGTRLLNIAKDRSYFSAEMWSFWTTYLAPVLLRRRFQRTKYYDHFVHLVRLLNLCLQFEIAEYEVDEIREGFIQWVQEYEEIYYQHKPDRLSTCPLTIHALLHIADSIRCMGPVWASWAFPMERFCGSMQRAIRSRRFPYASIDRYVAESAQLHQIANLYNIAEILALRTPRIFAGTYSHPDYPTCLLLPPKSPNRPAENLIAGIAGALATRFDADIRLVKKQLKNAHITEWGKVRRIDSDAGDIMCASSPASSCDDSRDATYVRYEMLVDKYARQSRLRPEYELQTFYGQLQHIYVVQFNVTCADLGCRDGTVIFLAAIKTCKLDKPDSQLRGLDIRFYSSEGGIHVVDITSVQCLIGRIWDRNRWAIIDRSGSLARAVYDEREDSFD